MLSPVHLLLALAVQSAPVSHDATVTITVGTGTIAIDDTLQVLTPGLALTIELHAGLNPVVSGARIMARSVDGGIETLSLLRDGEGVGLQHQQVRPGRVADGRAGGADGQGEGHGGD